MGFLVNTQAYTKENIVSINFFVDYINLWTFEIKCNFETTLFQKLTANIWKKNEDRNQNS